MDAKIDPKVLMDLSMFKTVGLKSASHKSKFVGGIYG